MKYQKIYLAVAALLQSTLVQAMYGGIDSKVVVLNEQNFKTEVLESDEMWLLEFYAPWCGHCKQLQPTWEKVAKNLKGVVKVGAIDADKEQALGQKYGIQGFPTIKFFGFNKKKAPVAYEGQRGSEDMIGFAMNKVSEGIKHRVSGKKDKSKTQGQQQQKQQQQQKKPEGGNKKASGSGEAREEDGVIVLTDSNFDKMVLQSKDIWIVEFYAPWCGHCKALEPEYAQAAKNLKGQIKLGKVDATVEKELGQRFGIQGFPTVKVFDYGMIKSVEGARDYQGERTAGAITTYGASLASKADIDPDVHQLIKQNVYAENCNGPVICVINFLPNIYDSNAKERNGYIKMIKKVAKKNRSQPFKWFWLQAGDQLDLERDLNLGFGYPAVIAISPGKKMVATMRGSYSENNVGQFLSDLLIGKGGLSKLSKDFKLKKAEKWDGKDAPPIQDNYEEL